jgi:phosphoribosylaminoimidazole-succinocarboxamide synthase
VATDRISAFDWVMPTGIPGKGHVLTAMSVFWFDWLKVPHHLLSTDLDSLPPPFRTEQLAGRTMHVCKTRVVPVECVARGYLAGSGWKEYRSTGRVCGLSLPEGLREAGKLPKPIFTPATKEEGGKHDENISFERMSNLIGSETSSELRARTLEIYSRAAEYTESRGIILADTKLEWGFLPSGELILIDEVLTPDSSRYWPAESYQAGSSPPSFDKQYLRDWLVSVGWDRMSPPPPLPVGVVERTQEKYGEALRRLTGTG